MTGSLQKTVSTLLVLFGSLVLGVSLLSANRISVGETGRATGKRIYVGRTILPDNVLYPFVMVADRVRLQTASIDEDIGLRLEYAERRFEYAVALLEKQEKDLSLTTLTKSQKYLFGAVEQVLANPKSVDNEKKQMVARAVDHSLYRLQLFKEKFGTDESGIITSLEQQTIIFSQQIHSATDPQ